jgi:RES domain-containing protein
MVLKTKTVDWKQAWRVIASRYPPIDLFERVSADPKVWDALIELEQLTNPRLRDEVGDIALVPPERRVAGGGASYVMASFTHVNPKGSRFSGGAYGIYYCAESIETAIEETIYHFEQAAGDSADPPRSETMRVLVGTIEREFHDVASLPADELAKIMHASSYEHSQKFGKSLREQGSDGVVYPSARREGGECVGAFWPDVVGIPTQERHLEYHWDGNRVDKYFDFSTNIWTKR